MKYTSQEVLDYIKETNSFPLPVDDRQVKIIGNSYGFAHWKLKKQCKILLKTILKGLKNDKKLLK